jgi:hypothetical protein
MQNPNDLLGTGPCPRSGQGTNDELTHLTDDQIAFVVKDVLKQCNTPFGETEASRWHASTTPL